MTRDEKLLITFLERNLPAMASTFDEGIGITSERYFVAKLIEKIMRQYQIKTVLEAPVDGLMGIPGLNSVYFARAGAKITVASPAKALLENAKKFWQKLNLQRMVRFVWDPEFKFPFKDESFDLVWNYCIFEHFQNGNLLPEMKRVSKNLILIISQNRYNWGYPIHRWHHYKNNQVWDHGYSELMDIFYLKKILKKAGLKVEMSGCFDIPPWFDTFDMHTRGLGKKLVGKKEEKWYWSALQEGDLEKLSQARLIQFLDFFQKILMFPFNLLFAHHFYFLASKENG